jgi:hypothetical protein
VSKLHFFLDYDYDNRFADNDCFAVSPLLSISPPNHSPTLRSAGRVDKHPVFRAQTPFFLDYDYDNRFADND